LGLSIWWRGSPWRRSTPMTAADLRQLIAVPQKRSLCRQAHACDRQLKENNRYAMSNRYAVRRRLRSSFFICSCGDGVLIKKTPHNKRGVSPKKSTGAKTGTAGILQGQRLIRKSSGFHKAGACSKAELRRSHYFVIV
jgi:hypothetical protein